MARTLHIIKRKTIKYVYIMKNQFKEVAQLVAAIRDLIAPNGDVRVEALNFAASRDTTESKERYTFRRLQPEEASITVIVAKTESGGTRVEWETVGELDIVSSVYDLHAAKNF